MNGRDLRLTCFILGAMIVCASAQVTNAVAPSSGSLPARLSLEQILLIASWITVPLFVYLLKDRRIKKLEHENQLALQKVKFLDDLRTDYDKDLRNHRIEHYQKLWAWMVNLPKYPNSKPLTVEGLRSLSLSFRDWYFGGGGLFLSENEDPMKFGECSRERYFDFQEGCKIVLKKSDNEWTCASEDTAKPDGLRKYFRRNEDWYPCDEIRALAQYPLKGPDRNPARMCGGTSAVAGEQAPVKPGQRCFDSARVSLK